MYGRTWMTALAIAMFAGAAVATAADREVVNGVTVLRGSGTLQNTGPAAPPTGTPTTSGSGGSYRPDNSGPVNSLGTGSANAGGEIGNLPPGAGR